MAPADLAALCRLAIGMTAALDRGLPCEALPPEQRVLRKLKAALGGAVTDRLLSDGGAMPDNTLRHIIWSLRCQGHRVERVCFGRAGDGGYRLRDGADGEGQADRAGRPWR